MIEAAAGGATILFSSHQITQVERAAERVAVMVRGRLILDENIDTLKSREKAIEATFEGALPTLDGISDLPSVRRVERAGSMLRLIVRQDEEEVARRVAALNPKSLRVGDRNLEDIFLDTVSEKS
jgi:ABC-2 type transport system ATP-binding protein